MLEKILVDVLHFTRAKSFEVYGRLKLDTLHDGLSSTAQRAADVPKINMRPS